MGINKADIALFKSTLHLLALTSQSIIIALVFGLLSGCAASNVPSFIYQWTPDTVAASGKIEATALVETDHELSPEMITMWRNMMNTEQNIANYRAAVSDALFEDMNRSHIFTGATRMHSDPHDMLVKVVSSEVKKKQHYFFNVTVQVIDPMSSKEILTYRRDADLGTSSFTYSYNLRDELSKQLADIRTAMLADFNGDQSPGYLAFFAPRREAKPAHPTAKEPTATKKLTQAPPPDTEPPKIIISSPREDRGLVTLRYKETEVVGTARDESKVITILVNGQEAQMTPLPRGGVNFTATVAIPPRQTELTVLAIDQNGNKAIKTLKIQHIAYDSPDKKEPLGMKPTLWVLAIGVSKYKDSNLNLKYADNDAMAIVNTLKEQKGKLFDEIQYKLLLNEDGTRENILDAMSKFLGMASFNDLVLIFIAGHGVKDRQTDSYYFMTYDATPDNLMTRGLLWSTFDEAHKRLAKNVSKVMLWLDTCHSGAMNVSMRGLESGEELSAALRSAEGTYILTASKPGESSEENETFKMKNENYGHGAFTYSLLEGLDGSADMDGDRSITVSELSSYVAKKVPRLTEGRQHPYFRLSGTDMPIYNH